MVDKFEVSKIGIRANKGVGREDSFFSIGVSSLWTEKDRILDVPDGPAILSHNYAIHYPNSHIDLPVVYIEKEEGRSSDMAGLNAKPWVEYAAVWVGGKWTGVKVYRTKIYEGVWAGYDEYVKCEGTFGLAEGWKEKILRAYRSKRSLDEDILHMSPEELR